MPNDPAYYPLYEAAAELALPVVFHTGQTGIGAGLPGGRGIKLRYSDPMLLDDVAADHPALTIVLAHPSVPWQDAAISMATHKANVFIDLSGWSPRYFPPQLVRAANSLLRRKVLFGSDYPMITPDRWLADFEQLEIKPDVRPLILKDNAARLLGLTKDDLRMPDFGVGSWPRRRARINPHRPAMQAGRAVLTYRDLADRVDKLAQYDARDRGATRGPDRLPRGQQHRRVRSVFRGLKARRDLHAAEHASGDPRTAIHSSGLRAGHAVPRQ